MTLFVTKTNPSEFAGWTFNNNCLNTVIESSSIIVANDNTLSSLIGSLDNNKCTDFECDKLPEGIDESKIEYQCYHYFNFETVETEKVYCLFIIAHFLCHLHLTKIHMEELFIFQQQAKLQE